MAIHRTPWIKQEHKTQSLKMRLGFFVTLLCLQDAKKFSAILTKRLCQTGQRDM